MISATSAACTASCNLRRLPAAKQLPAGCSSQAAARRCLPAVVRAIQQHPGGSSSTPLDSSCDLVNGPEISLQSWDSKLAPLAAQCGDADVMALAQKVEALAKPRQQGVIEQGPAVAAYLQDLGVPPEQLSRLLHRCPRLFSWPVERRAGVLFDQLMGLGLTGAEAARCFDQSAGAAGKPTFAPAIAALSALMVSGSKPGDAGRTGEQLLGDLLRKQPAAAMLLQLKVEVVEERIEYLLKLGISRQQLVAALKMSYLLLNTSPAHLERLKAVLQQELGSDSALWAKVLRHSPRVLSSNEANWRQRVKTLVAEFGRQEALELVTVCPALLAIYSTLWQLGLKVLQQYGVADPYVVVRRNPGILTCDWTHPNRVCNLLALQQHLPGRLSAAGVIERWPGYVSKTDPRRLAGRFLYLNTLGLLPLFVASKGAARREWRQRLGLTLTQRAGNEPQFISVGDVCTLSDGNFSSLPALCNKQLASTDASCSSTSGTISAAEAASAFNYAAFQAGLEQLPAWQQLMAEAKRVAAQLCAKLPPELLRQAGTAGAAEEAAPTALLD